MRLPDRLDYHKERLEGETWPVVFCTVPGCRWTHDNIVWSDLDDDGDIDWDAVHPAHEETS